MAKKYIDADLLIKTIRDNDYLVVDYFNSKDRGMFTTGIMQAIDEQPTADVRENVRGEWIDFGHDFYGDYEYKCSSCGMTANYTTDFCPHCGCSMKEKKGEWNQRN